MLLTSRASPQASSFAAVEQLMHDGKFAQADAALCPLIAGDPKAAEPRYLLAYALLREDELAESLKEYTSAGCPRQRPAHPPVCVGQILQQHTVERIGSAVTRL